MPLQTHLQPFRDYALARRFAWDPHTIDLRTDVEDWRRLTSEEQQFMTHLLSLFLAGEEAVASDLSPLLWALRRVGGLREEEMFVTSQLLDESRHVEFFHRWFDEVLEGPVDFKSFASPSYEEIFTCAMPQALAALLSDQSPRAIARALLTYHIIVEGVLAETGYHAVFTACEKNSILPGLRSGITFIKRDESRHIAYGIYAVQRLLTEDPALLPFIAETTEGLLTTALGVIPEALAPYGEHAPFGVTLEAFVTYASEQFARRYAALERAVT